MLALVGVASFLTGCSGSKYFKDIAVTMENWIWPKLKATFASPLVFQENSEYSPGERRL